MDRPTFFDVQSADQTSKKCIRKGSFFEDAHLSIPQIMYLTYCWAAELSVKSTVHISDVCELVQSNNYSFGDPGVVVQIDESLVAKRKYNVGRVVDQQWVFGLYDTQTKLGHIELVNDRTAATLIPIIRKFMRPGSTIFSDNGQLANMSYQHQTVNHSENFIDPVQYRFAETLTLTLTLNPNFGESGLGESGRHHRPTTGAGTNAIEAYWSCVKRHVKLHWLSDRDQLPLRIDERLWRDRHSEKCNDDCILRHDSSNGELGLLTVSVY